MERTRRRTVGRIRAAMQRVKAAGGEVIGKPMAIPGLGEYAVFRDTEGNHHSMMQPDMAPPACNI